MKRERIEMFETKVRCTGGRRSPHKSRQLAQITYTLYRETDGSENASLFMQDGPTHTDNYWANAKGAVEHSVQFRGVFSDGAGSWFKCPTCQREARLKTEKLGEAMIALYQAGHDTLDISILG